MLKKYVKLLFISFFLIKVSELSVASDNQHHTKELATFYFSGIFTADKKQELYQTLSDLKESELRILPSKTSQSHSLRLVCIDEQEEYFSDIESNVAEKECRTSTCTNCTEEYNSGDLYCNRCMKLYCVKTSCDVDDEYDADTDSPNLKGNRQGSNHKMKSYVSKDDTVSR